MKSAPSGFAPIVISRWPQRGRRFAAIAMLVVGTVVATAQNAVTTLAGTPGTSGLDNGTGRDARFRLGTGTGVVVDSAGNLFVADAQNNVIRKATPAGVVTTFAGSATGVSGADDGSATVARFSTPQAIAIDASDNLYVADTGNNKIRKITSAGEVSTVAGSGVAGLTDAAGLSAQFRAPAGVAVASTANTLFVSDTQNHVIRQINLATRAVTTVAGSASAVAGFANGTNADALFSSPMGILTDTLGTLLYVADAANNVVRKIEISGATATVSTFVGSGSAGYANGNAATAQFISPRGLAFDASGNIIVVDSGTHTLRTVTPAGDVSLLAGTPLTAGFSDTVVSLARFNTPTSVAISGTTATYIADSGNFVLRKISAAAIPTFTTQPASATISVGNNAVFTAAATGNPAVSYKWQRLRIGDATFADLTELPPYSGTNTATLTISGVTAAMDGDLLRVLASSDLATVPSSNAQITTSLGLVFSTYAGKAGVAGTTDGAAAAARFGAPSGVVVGATGITYVADTANHVIRAIAADGTVTTLAGKPGVAGSADGFGDVARFASPTGLTIDAAGNLWVADTSNHTIRRVLSNGYVMTVAGTAQSMGTTDGNGASARFAIPTAITVDAAGTLYVADTLNHTIRKIAADGTVSTIAGQPGVSGSADGNRFTSKFSYPQGIAVDAAGNVYVADTLNSTIRKVTAGDVTSTIAGTAGSAGNVDGNLSTARLNQPKGIMVFDATTLYVTDSLNHTIRRVTTSGDVTTVAGLASTSGSADGPGSDARFNQPAGITMDASGNFYVADTQNHTIRRSGAFTAPSITTQPANTLVTAGSTATFAVSASGLPAPIFRWQRQAAGTSGFINIDNDSTYSGVTTASLTIAGVTQAMSGDQFQVMASNLVSPPATSDAATLTVRAPDVAPTITTGPVSAVVSRGETTTFSVTATGSGTLVYQWNKDGNSISGATNSTLTITDAQPANSGVYTVIVTNVAGTISGSASLTVNTAPVLSTPPRTQTGVAGGAVTFTSEVSGGGSMAYQWRKNGVAIPGANGPTLTLTNVSSADVALYDLVATNSLGSITTAPALLTVGLASAAPVVTAQPESDTVVAGSSTRLIVAAAGAPAPTYQWRKNGVAINGATGTSLSLNGVTASDAGNYDVVITNSAGTTASATASLRVVAKSYAGVYFGTFSGGLGSFALRVWPDNMAVFVGVVPASAAGIVNLNVSVNDAGQFSFVQSATGGATGSALAATTVNGSIANDGTVTGTLSGGAVATLSGTRAPDTGPTQALAGLYLAGALNSASSMLTIVSANGQAYALAQVGTSAAGGLGAIGSNGQLAVSTGQTSIIGTVTPSTGTMTGSAVGAVSGTFTGASESALSVQRLANISTRARVSGGDSVAIAGFVISGTESKLVLIRAVGPTLSGFGVTGALTTPKLDLYRGSTVLATNTGVSTSLNSAAIAAAGLRAGAFALGASGADSAILTTLPPGGYTAQVSGNGGGSGVALVELYDLSNAAAGQKLVNISTRAAAAAGENALIAGVVVSGTTPKRVLIRAIGPGLATFGVTGQLAQPVLELKTQAGVTLTQNTGWSNSADSAAIRAASLDVGAFPLVTGDSALIVTLAPGAYSAQVTGSGGTSGIALVEIYELQ